MEYKHFEILEVDITNFKSPEEILNSVNLSDDIYRIVLKGERNVEVEKIKEILNAECKNICEIRDLTHLSYDFEKIAKEQNLKGFFTKKMLEELREKPEQKEEIIAFEKQNSNSLFWRSAFIMSGLSLSSLVID